MFFSFRPLSLLFFLLVAACSPVVQGQTSFTKDFGTGSALVSSGLDSLTTNCGGVATCSFTCSSTSTNTITTLLYIRFDGNADPVFNDGDSFDATGCASSVSATSSLGASQLGWTITSATYNSLVMTCSSAGGSATCFSEDTTVNIQGKEGWTPIRELQVGDKVLTSSGTYQPVYSFGHRQPLLMSDFVQLYTDEEQQPLELSPSHMVFVDETSYLFGLWPQKKAVRADSVQVGDVLVYGTTAKRRTVTQVDYIENKKGVYMPLTTDGTILVNGGLHASTYVSIADEYNQVQSVLESFEYYGFDEQNMNQWWMAPYRMMCMGVSSKYCYPTNLAMVYQVHGPDFGILKWLLAGRTFAQFANPYSFVLHHVFFIPAAIVLGMLMMMETVLGGPAVAPSALLALVTAAIWFWNRCGKQRRANNEMMHLIKKNE